MFSLDMSPHGWFGQPFLPAPSLPPSLPSKSLYFSILRGKWNQSYQNEWWNLQWHPYLWAYSVTIDKKPVPCPGIWKNPPTSQISFWSPNMSGVENFVYLLHLLTPGGPDRGPILPISSWDPQISEKQAATRIQRFLMFYCLLFSKESNSATAVRFGGKFKTSINSTWPWSQRTFQRQRSWICHWNGRRRYLYSQVGRNS